MPGNHFRKMKNRTITQSWKLFRRLTRTHANATRQTRMAETVAELESAVRRANCASFMLTKLSDYLGKHTA